MRERVNKQELDTRIEYNRYNAEAAKLQAMLRHGEIVSGGYKLKDTEIGRKNTPEEIASGDTSLKFRDQTDEEKLKDTINTMQRHINWYRDYSEAVCTMMSAKQVNINGETLYEYEVQ